MNSIFEDMEEEQSSNINNLEQDDLTSVASLAKKQKNQEQKVKDLEAELKEAKKELLRISDEEIPNLMTEQGWHLLS
jgi:molecular chaperone GrpE (heat shock protein)